MSENILQVLDFFKHCPDGSQLDEERMEAGYLMLG